MSAVAIGDGQKFQDHWAWCKGALQSAYPSELKPCNSFNTWFWCPTPSTDECKAPGDNPLESADNEKFRKQLKDAFLGAPAMYERIAGGRGTGQLTATNYNVARKTFRIFLATSRTYTSLGGAPLNFSTTWKVQTVFGPIKRAVPGSIYEPARIIFELTMEENLAREFYNLALPFGCSESVDTDCPLDNLVAEIVYRIVDHKVVGQDCSGGSCESRSEDVFKLLGVRLRVADSIDRKSDKPFSFQPGQTLFEQHYR